MPSTPPNSAVIVVLPRKRRSGDDGDDGDHSQDLKAAMPSVKSLPILSTVGNKGF